MTLADAEKTAKFLMDKQIVCICGCGRLMRPNKKQIQYYATPECRKKYKRRYKPLIHTELTKKRSTWFWLWLWIKRMLKRS